eukprot:GHVL01028036.1.p1 GENE.GHVL01028036.1~~GHVL01028036.1.p1  ORF type:complete len:200 (+),score=56.93 GHVL01028036.1:658-1257(+)
MIINQNDMDISNKTVSLFSSKLISKNLRGILTVLIEFHKISISHGAVKPSNLFITTTGSSLQIGHFKPKIAQISALNDLSNGVDGSASSMYTAPEIIQYFSVSKRQYKDKCVDFCLADVWSLGVTFLHLLTFLPPMGCNLNEKIIEKMIDDLSDSKIFEDGLLEVVKSMLNFDLKSRPNSVEALKMMDDLGLGLQTTKE